MQASGLAAGPGESGPAVSVAAVAEPAGEGRARVRFRRRSGRRPPGGAGQVGHIRPRMPRRSAPERISPLQRPEVSRAEPGTTGASEDSGAHGCPSATSEELPPGCAVSEERREGTPSAAGAARPPPGLLPPGAACDPRAPAR